MRDPGDKRLVGQMSKRGDGVVEQWFWLRNLAAVAAFFIAVTLPAAATEPIGAGGLLIAISPGLVIESSEITVTPSQVRHVYRIRNRGRTQKAALVTFVMPELDRFSLAEEGGWRALRDPVNIVAATTTVDGKTIDLRAQQRAVALGLDVTAQVAAARLSLIPLDPKLDVEIGRLDPGTSSDLTERGILQIDDGRARPGWVLQTTAYWRQTIEPGVLTVIEHSYTPLVGVQVLSEQSLERAVEQSCLSTDRAARLSGRLDKPDLPVLTTVSLLQSTLFGQEPPELTELRIEIPADGLETTLCLEPLIRSNPQTLSWKSRQSQIERDLTIVFVRGRPGR